MKRTLSKPSKSLCVAEAFIANVEADEWQLREIQTSITELDAGQEANHQKVSKWLDSWGKQSEKKAPR